MGVQRLLRPVEDPPPLRNAALPGTESDLVFINDVVAENRHVVSLL